MFLVQMLPFCEEKEMQRSFGLHWMLIFVLLNPLLISGYITRPSTPCGLDFGFKVHKKSSTRSTSENCAFRPTGNRAQFLDNCLDDVEGIDGFDFFEEIGLENIVKYKKDNEGKIEYLWKRAAKQFRITALRAKSEVRKSAEARSWLASTFSDFATLLGFGLFTSALPFSLDKKTSDELHVAIFGALINATTEVLEHKGKSFTASEAKPEKITNFVVRNALVPAALHRVVTIATDIIVQDAKSVESYATIELKDVIDKVLPCLQHLFPFLHI